MSIRSSDANSDFAPLNYVHCVTDITSMEQDFVSRAVKHLDQFTQLLGARVVERLKQGHLTQCFNGHRGRQILSTPKYARSKNTVQLNSRRASSNTSGNRRRREDQL